MPVPRPAFRDCPEDVPQCSAPRKLAPGRGPSGCLAPLSGCHQFVGRLPWQRTRAGTLLQTPPAASLLQELPSVLAIRGHTSGGTAQPTTASPPSRGGGPTPPPSLGIPCWPHGPCVLSSHVALPTGPRAVAPLWRVSGLTGRTAGPATLLRATPFPRPPVFSPGSPLEGRGCLAMVDPRMVLSPLFYCSPGLKPLPPLSSLVWSPAVLRDGLQGRSPEWGEGLQCGW